MDSLGTNMRIMLNNCHIGLLFFCLKHPISLLYIIKELCYTTINISENQGLEKVLVIKVFSESSVV